MKGQYDETHESTIRSSDMFNGMARERVHGKGHGGFWNKDHAKPGPVRHIVFPAGMSIPENFTGDLVAPSPYAVKKDEPTLA